MIGVDPKRDVIYLDYLSARLSEFIGVFDELMALHVENTGLRAIGRGLAPAAIPREDADKSRIASLSDELHRLAGTLMDLSSVTSVRMEVQGAGPIDPFVNWASILEPRPLLESSNVKGCALQAAGRLEGMRARAEALAAPDLDPVRLHPLVWASAQHLWRDGHYRQALAAAADAVTGQMKHRTGRNDAPDTSLWQQAFSDQAPAEGKPRLRWPGDPSDQDVRTMNGGLRQFAPGISMVIRNPATHVREDLTEQAALERLAALSVLAHLLEQCETVTISTP